MFVAAAPVTCTLRPPFVVSAASVGVPHAGVFSTKVTFETFNVVAAAFAPLTMNPSISQTDAFTGSRAIHDPHGFGFQFLG